MTSERVHVSTQAEAKAIFPDRKLVEAQSVDGVKFYVNYDKLAICTGSQVRLPGCQEQIPSCAGHMNSCQASMKSAAASSCQQHMLLTLPKRLLQAKGTSATGTITTTGSCGSTQHQSCSNTTRLSLAGTTRIVAPKPLPPTVSAQN